MVPGRSGGGGRVVDEVELTVEARHLDDLRDGAAGGWPDDDELRADTPGAGVGGHEDADAARVHELEAAQVDDDLVALRRSAR